MPWKVLISVKFPWPHLFIPYVLTCLLWLHLHCLVQEGQEMSSSTLPHCASAGLHSALYKARQILPNFQDESALPGSAPKQGMCVNWCHLDQSTGLVSGFYLFSCTAIIWWIKMHPEKYDGDKYITTERQIFFCIIHWPKISIKSHVWQHLFQTPPLKALSPPSGLEPFWRERDRKTVKEIMYCISEVTGVKRNK